MEQPSSHVIANIISMTHIPDRVDQMCNGDINYEEVKSMSSEDCVMLSARQASSRSNMMMASNISYAMVVLRSCLQR